MRAWWRDCGKEESTIRVRDCYDGFAAGGLSVYCEGKG